MSAASAAQWEAAKAEKETLVAQNHEVASAIGGWAASPEVQLVDHLRALAQRMAELKVVQSLPEEKAIAAREAKRAEVCKAEAEAAATAGGGGGEGGCGVAGIAVDGASAGGGAEPSGPPIAPFLLNQTPLLSESLLRACEEEEAKAVAAEKELAAADSDQTAGLVVTAEVEWRPITLARDQAWQHLVQLCAVQVAGLQAKCATLTDALEMSDIDEPAPKPLPAAPEKPTDAASVAAWESAKGIAARLAVAEAEQFETTSAMLKQSLADLEAANLLNAKAASKQRRRVYCETLLDAFKASHDQLVSNNKTLKSAKRALFDLLELDDDDEADEDDLEVDDEDEPAIKKAKIKYSELKSKKLEMLRSRESYLADIVDFSRTLDLEVSDLVDLDGFPSVDLPDIPARARQLIRPVKKKKGGLKGKALKEYHMLCLLERNQILVEDRSMADYTDDDIPEDLDAATAGKMNVDGKRLPDGSTVAGGESGNGAHQLKVLKSFPVEEYKRVQRSINAAHRLKHPGIVPVECAFMDKGKGVVVVQLPYFAGGDLRRWVARAGAEARSKGVLLATSLRIAQAVEFLHLNKLLHRDIKPENIVMDAKDDAGLPALCDFDLCVAADQTMTTATTRRGTPLYMPPDASVSPAADVYALGITLLDIFFCGGDYTKIPTSMLPGALGPSVDPNGIVRLLGEVVQKDASMADLATLVADMVATDSSKRPHMSAVVGRLQKLVEDYLAETNRQLEARQTAVEADRAQVEAAGANVAARSSDMSDRAAQLAAEEQRIAREKKSLAREKERLAQTDFPAPDYWKHRDLRKVHCGLKVSKHVKDKMQRLLRGNNLHSSACGHSTHSMAHATVTKVERIENTVLWKNYHHKKSTMAELARGSRDPDEVKPSGLLASEVIHRPLNEVRLFHGTAQATAQLIAKHGFDERLASMGGLYGAGCYFAENACKSSQYAPGTHGEHTILLCRVLLGDSYRTSTRMGQARRPPNKGGHSGKTFDSVLASGGTQVHREFMVYDKTQVYPEYIIYYRL